MREKYKSNQNDASQNSFMIFFSKEKSVYITLTVRALGDHEKPIRTF